MADQALATPAANSDGNSSPSLAAQKRIHLRTRQIVERADDAMTAEEKRRRLRARSALYRKFQLLLRSMS